MSSADQALRRGILDGDLAEAQLALEQGASIDLPDEYGYAPLYNAARNGPPEMVALLISHGAAVGLRNRYGWTALHKAAINGHAEIVEQLLAAGAAVDPAGDHCVTPLMSAACWGRVDAVRILLAHGADPNVRDPDGLNSVSYARLRGFPEAAPLLEEAGAIWGRQKQKTAENVQE